MSVTFTKLFSSITESTVWCEPDRTRLVWITMLAMADKHGRVWGSIPGLANRARVPVEDVRIAIATFLSPDPDSRTADHEGKRIEPIDGGWRLLNYKKFRAVRDEEDRRSYKAEKEAERRERLRGQNGQNGQTCTGVDSNGHNAEAEAEAEADAEAEAEAEAVKKEQKQKQASPSAPSCVKGPLQDLPEQRATQGTNENSPSGPEQNGIESLDVVATASEKQIPCGNDKPRGNGQSSGNGISNGNGRSNGNEKPNGSGKPNGSEKPNRDDKPTGNDRRNEVQQVYAVYPKKVGSTEALKSIGKAIARLRSKGTADPVAYLIARIEGWLARRARDAAVGEFVPSYPNPATWFNQERYNDPDNAPKPKMEYRVLSPEEAAELWEREVVRHGQVHH